MLLKDKTVVFTGATRGMGHFAALELAQRGATIIIVGHNPARGAEAVEAIRAASGSAEFLQADMADAADVRLLAQRVPRAHDRIDVLIHSAGGLAPANARTREGVDRGFAQNFLGPYLLTRLLEERLLASAPARVIAVGSSTHRMVKAFDFNEFMHPERDLSRSGSFQRGSYQMRSYQVSKLAVTAWIHSLARRWAGRGVTANLLDPAMVKSELGENFEGPALMGFMMSRLVPFFAAVDPKRAAEQYVRLATDPALADVSGMYFVSGKVGERPDSSSQLSRDPAVQQRIIDAAEAWAAPFLPAESFSNALTESVGLVAAAQGDEL